MFNSEISDLNAILFLISFIIGFIFGPSMFVAIEKILKNLRNLRNRKMTKNKE